MPNRLIKESINESRGLTSCTFFAQDLYKRLITYADDYGRFNADPQIMLARLYPRDLSVVSLDDLIEALIELTGTKKISFYTSKARHEVYGAFPRWSEHQRVRDSKKKAPDPDETGVNDWYLRRFIPFEMKVAIVERDKYKCKICGKHIAETDDARRLVKMGAGLLHFDHVVPCSQGGRATMENLRLTCPKCNLSRKKMFSFEEILEFSKVGEESPRVAASCGDLPPNPIQSESESISESESNARGKRTRFVPPTHEEAQEFFLANGGTHIQVVKFMAHYGSNGWKVGKNPMKDWKSSARGWIARDREGGVTARIVPTQAAQPGTTNPFLQMLEEEGYSP